MIITCPSCSTRFYLDEDRIPEKGARGRCSRCRQIFEIRRPVADPLTKPSAEDLRPNLPEPAQEGTGDSRRKRYAARRFPALTLFLSLVLLAGAGYLIYQLWEQSVDLKKVTLSFSTMRQYIGLKEEKEGFISLEKIRGYYVENAKSQKMFIIEGQAVNHWNGSRSFIRVKAALLDRQGTRVKEKTVYCGNLLLEKDLKELPAEAIEKSLTSQFGESFSNVNIPPQRSVPFMIVFEDLSTEEPATKSSVQPPGASGDPLPALADFVVEVVSSQKGSK